MPTQIELKHKYIEYKKNSPDTLEYNYTIHLKTVGIQK